MKPISPNDFGNSALVESCQKIRIEDFIRKAGGQVKEALLASQLEAVGVGVELITSRTRFGGKRFWFKCPTCAHRVGVLYQHPLSRTVGCRKCLGLKYRQQRHKGMIEERITKP